MKRQRKAQPKYQTPVPNAGIDELRCWAEDVRVLHRCVKPNTALAYQRMAHAMAEASQREGRELLAIALDTCSARTWFARRAALLHSCAGELTACSNWDEDSLRAIAERIDEINTARLPIEGRTQRRSKRRDVDGRVMGDDWREQIIDSMGHKWRKCMTILASSGCRPAELMRGIRIEKFPNGEVALAIPGAKVSANAGHDMRILVFPRGNRWHQRLSELFGDAEIVTLPSSPASLTSTIRAKARQIWPLRRKTITSYCFRHESASEWKHAGYSRSEVALMLGHRTTAMQKNYGGRRIGTNRVSPSEKIRVAASHAHALRVKSPFSGGPVKSRNRVPTMES